MIDPHKGRVRRGRKETQKKRGKKMRKQEAEYGIVPHKGRGRRRRKKEEEEAEEERGRIRKCPL